MEDLSELMEAVKDYKWGRSGASLLAINAEIRKILGHPERQPRGGEESFNQTLPLRRNGVCASGWD